MTAMSPLRVKNFTEDDDSSFQHGNLLADSQVDNISCNSEYSIGIDETGVPEHLKALVYQYYNKVSENLITSVTSE